MRFPVKSLLAAVAGALLASGCASLGSPSESAEEAVLQRAQARWDALVDREWAAAYKFMTPAYRAIVPQRRYGNQFQGPVQWESAKAESAKCDEKRCVVQVRIDFRALLPKHADKVTTTWAEEVWVLEDGQWYKFEPI